MLVFFVGCSSEEFELINLDTAKHLVQNYYESGRFDAECKTVFNAATAKIDTVSVEKNSAVVFDIDETALSNYNHTKKIGFGFVLSLWNSWLLKADAPAIPPTKKYYDLLIKKGFRIIFITGRYEETKEATIKNLSNVGYTKYDTLILRRDDERNIPAAEFKAQKRAELVKLGYKIVACVGDQWSDLVGGNSGIKIKLPNYLYIID